MKKVLILIISAFVLILQGCQSNKTTNDPKEVLDHFFEALAKKDVTEAKKYVTKDSEGMMGMVEMGMKNVGDSSPAMVYKKENIIMGEPVINGDRATIGVTDKMSKEETDFVLKKEHGEWKVAFDKSTLMEMAQKKMKEHGLNGMGMDSINLDSVDLDSIQKQYNNMDSADKQKINKIMDSAENILEKMQKNVK
jgi:hypothetical protein